MAKKSVVVMVLFAGLFGIWMSRCETQEQKVERLTNATYNVAYILAQAFRLS